jgi:hypothetical protein
VSKSPARRASAHDLELALASEVRVRRAELAALERGLAIMQRQARGEQTVPCGHGAPECDGPVAARFCATCGAVIARCHVHGGIRAATYEMDHRHQCAEVAP